MARYGIYLSEQSYNLSALPHPSSLPLIRFISRHARMHAQPHLCKQTSPYNPCLNTLVGYPTTSLLLTSKREGLQFYETYQELPVMKSGQAGFRCIDEDSSEEKLQTLPSRASN